MTFAPQSLLACRDVFQARFPQIPDEGLGIVGGPSHVLTGTSYHLGADQLKMGRDPYSARTARDKAGLSNAASAFDITDQIGVVLLRQLSIWLVAQCRVKAADTLDIREITFSPNGEAVLTWDRENGVTSFPVQRGSLSHRTHTHVGFYRDSEHRNRHAVFERFFTERGQMNEQDFLALIWRMEAVFNNREKVVGGPLAGEENQLYATLKRFEAKLDTPDTLITDEQLERVLRRIFRSVPE